MTRVEVSLYPWVSMTRVEVSLYLWDSMTRVEVGLYPWDSMTSVEVSLTKKIFSKRETRILLRGRGLRPACFTWTALDHALVA